MREAIRADEGAIRDPQRDPIKVATGTIRSHQRRSAAIRYAPWGHWQSRAIKGNQGQSRAIKGHQGPSRAIGPSVYLGASLREGLLHKDRPDPPEGVRPLQPRALIDGVVTAQLWGGEGAVVSTCMQPRALIDRVVTAQLRHQASSSVIMRHQASSSVIRRHQASSVVIRVVTAQLRGVRSARRGERMHACLRSFPRDQLRDQ